MRSQRLTRNPELMGIGDSALLVVDLQERLLAAQPDAERIVWNTRRLIDGGVALGLPVAVTEQAPEKLGPTTSDLAERLPAPIAKSAFSAGVCEELLDGWHASGVRHVVLAGIETHVCVAQTALDLVSMGFQARVVVDAVGSRFAIDHDTALRRLDSSAVGLTTTEAALFELCETADHGAFRAISSLAKQTAPAG